MNSLCCKTVLVVEDDEDIRILLKHVLESEGYKVESAGDGREALEKLRISEKPCLILLDMMLPVMNGWEFLDEVKKDTGNMLAAIPIVVASAAGATAAKAAQGVQGYIRKPIDLDLLLHTVEKYCASASVEMEVEAQKKPA